MARIARSDLPAIAPCNRRSAWRSGQLDGEAIDLIRSTVSRSVSELHALTLTRRCVDLREATSLSSRDRGVPALACTVAICEGASDSIVCVETRWQAAGAGPFLLASIRSGQCGLRVWARQASLSCRSLLDAQGATVYVLSPARSSKGEICRPKAEIRRPKGEICHPKAEIRRPKGEIRRPKAEIRRPSGPRGCP